MDSEEAQWGSGAQLAGVECSADSVAMRFVIPDTRAASVASSWEHVGDSAGLLPPAQAGSAPTAVQGLPGFAGPKRLLRSLSKLKEVQPLPAP